jgi:hypothetical protein
VLGYFIRNTTFSGCVHPWKRVPHPFLLVSIKNVLAVFSIRTHFNPKKRIGNVNVIGEFGTPAESTVQCAGRGWVGVGWEQASCAEKLDERTEWEEEDRTKKSRESSKKREDVFCFTALTDSMYFLDK